MQTVQQIATAAANNLLTDECYTVAYFTGDCAYFDMLDGIFPSVGTCKAEQECSDEHYEALSTALADTMHQITGLRQDNELSIDEVTAIIRPHLRK